MAMEKYSQDNDLLLKQLQDEEHDLMRKVAAYMSSQVKTAAEERDMAQVDMRLGQVRGKITELLHSKKEPASR